MFEESYQQEPRIKAILFGERYSLNNEQLRQLANNERGLMAKQYQVYMLECEDGSYYTGITIDIDKRFKQHLSGKGAKYTRSHKPVKIVIRSAPMDKSSALKLEHRIKQLSHEQKKMLIVDRQGTILAKYMKG